MINSIQFVDKSIIIIIDGNRYIGTMLNHALPANVYRIYRIFQFERIFIMYKDGSYAFS